MKCEKCGSYVDSTLIEVTYHFINVDHWFFQEEYTCTKCGHSVVIKPKEWGWLDRVRMRISNWLDWLEY